jgi:hypothetical protein
MPTGIELIALEAVIYVMVAFWALRKALGVSPAIALAGIAPVALHPGFLEQPLVAGALGMTSIGLIAWVEHRIEARKWQEPAPRLEVPVVGPDASGEIAGIAVIPREAPADRNDVATRILDWVPVAVAGCAFAAALVFVLIQDPGQQPAQNPSGPLAGRARAEAEAFAVIARNLPAWVLPQVFSAQSTVKLPSTVADIWGVLMALTLLSPILQLARQRGLAERVSGVGAFLMLGLALITAPTALFPAAALFTTGIWLWKAGEHRFERQAAERFKDYAALAWVALCFLFRVT